MTAELDLNLIPNYYLIDFKFHKASEFQIGNIMGRIQLIFEFQIKNVVTCTNGKDKTQLIIGIDKDVVDPVKKILIPACKKALFHEFLFINTGIADVGVYCLDMQMNLKEKVFEDKNYTNYKGKLMLSTIDFVID